MKKKTLNQTQLDTVLDMLIAFSQGNFKAKGEVSDEDSDLNAVISGLNMLSEELVNYQEKSSGQDSFIENILGGIDEVVYARKIHKDQGLLGSFTYVSKRCQEIIGLNSFDLHNDQQLWIKAVHPDDLLYCQSGLAQLLNGGSTVLVYRLYHSQQKSFRYIEDRITVCVGDDGTSLQLYGSARDITQQQQDKMELESKNEFISRIISSSDQFFYIVAIQPEDTFENKFTYLSWQIEKIQGSTVDQLKNTSKGWISLVHPDDLEKLKEDNRRMFSTCLPIMRTYRVKHAHRDEYIWLEDYVIPVADQSGRVTELYGSARDVNSRKRVELEREALNLELNHRYNELMQFSYIVSHNLRSPISNILGLARLLNSGISGTDAKTTTGYIRKAAERMDEQLYDLNMILSSRSNIHEKKEEVDIAEVVEAVCSTLKNELEETFANIEVSISPEAGKLFTIKSYLHSIIFNLLSNSLKYRSVHRQPSIQIQVYLSDGRTRVIFTDNGDGMDLNENGESIFGLFRRLDTAKKGSGLGLYMTKTQIESLGGSIQVQSIREKGTVFTIIF